MLIFIEATLATLDEDVVFGFVSPRAIASFCHVAYRDPMIRVEFENVEVLCHLFLSVSRYSSVITKV